jgi:hypothetical protein
MHPLPYLPDDEDEIRPKYEQKASQENRVLAIVIGIMLLLILVALVLLIWADRKPSKRPDPCQDVITVCTYDEHPQNHLPNNP